VTSPSDVIVRVQLASICGSDLHVYYDREKGMDPGAVMGHEFAGEIVDAGLEVRRFKPGDHVVAPFTTNCGECFYCRSGLTARCTRGQLFGWVQNGAGLQGGQAEYVRVPLADTTLIPQPDGLADEVALLLGDVLPTGFFCAEMAGAGPEGTYAVIGCGPVGLMAVAGARECGAERVYAIDRVPERLLLAKEFGAIPLDGREVDPLEGLRQATDGRGADAVMEVVGSEAALRLALDLVRPGGVLSVVGVHNEPQFSFSPTEAYDKNLTYRVGRCPARHYAERLTEFVQKSKLRISVLFSHRIPLSEGAEGYRIFDEKRDGCTKVLLMPTSDQR
jgi:threonine dehydrogenase-like Zn-dependent dehydrogenase